MRQLFGPIITSAKFQIRNSMARAMMRFVVLIQPLILATITYFMYTRSGAGEYGGYVVVGTSVATLWMTTLWSSATDINRERSMGTLGFLLISPTPFPVVLAGKVLGNTLLGVFSLLLTSLYSALVLKVHLPTGRPALVLVALIATVIGFVAFASVLAFAFTLSREANAIANGLNYPVWLVSGLLFPITMLPGPARLVGLAMPMAWAKETLEWATYGGASSSMLTGSFSASLSGLCIVSCAYLVIARPLYYRVIEHRIYRSGQTEAM